MNRVCSKASLRYRKHSTSLLTVVSSQRPSRGGFPRLHSAVVPSACLTEYFRSCPFRGRLRRRQIESETATTVRDEFSVMRIFHFALMTFGIFHRKPLSCDIKTKWVPLRTFHTIFPVLPPRLKGFTLKKCFIATFSFYIAFPSMTLRFLSFLEFSLKHTFYG